MKILLTRAENGVPGNRADCGRVIDSMMGNYELRDTADVLNDAPEATNLLYSSPGPIDAIDIDSARADGACGLGINKNDKPVPIFFRTESSPRQAGPSGTLAKLRRLDKHSIDDRGGEDRRLRNTAGPYGRGRPLGSRGGEGALNRFTEPA